MRWGSGIVTALSVIVATPSENLSPPVDSRRVRSSARHRTDLVRLKEIDGLEPTLALLMTELTKIVGAADENAPLFGDDCRVAPSCRDLDDRVAFAAGIPQHVCHALDVCRRSHVRIFQAATEAELTQIT